ncbi:hypothetical protein BEQ56_08450 [Anaerolineaceae bacterium oral taxon 439]|nr:hypothetical protein BEQ56_08450 [Anaerolineaceae bacterium oral taxon 439]
MGILLEILTLSFADVAANGSVKEIQEWRSILKMGLRRLPDPESARGAFRWQAANADFSFTDLR